jgi:bacteriorhodopsin
MLKRLQETALAATFLVTSATVALAQSPPSTPADGTGTWTSGNWLWIIVAVVVIGGLVWYFTQGRTTRGPRI